MKSAVAVLAAALVTAAQPAPTDIALHGAPAQAGSEDSGAASTTLQGAWGWATHEAAASASPSAPVTASTRATLRPGSTRWATRYSPGGPYPTPASIPHRSRCSAMALRAAT